MDFSTFGPEHLGTRVAEKDISERHLEAMHAALYEQEALSAPGKRAVEAARTRLYDTQNAQRQKQMQDLQLMQQLSQVQAQDIRAGGGKPDESPEDQADRFAQLLYSAGLPNEATKVSNASSQRRLRTEQVRRAASQTEIAELGEQRKQVEAAYGFVSGAGDDQQAFDSANAVYERVMGVESPFKGMAASKEALQTLGNALLSQKQRVDKSYQDARMKLDQENKSSLNEDRRLRRADLERRTLIQEARERRLSKAAGDKRAVDKAKAIPVAKTDELVGARNALKLQDPSQSDDNIKAVAPDVANRAKQLMQENKALNFTEALQRAIGEEQAAGNLKPGTPWGPWNMFPGKGEVTREGKSASSPIPLSPKTKLVRNRYYQNPQGRLFYNTADGLVPYSPTTGGDGEDDETDPADEPVDGDE